ncbi:MAG: cysteine hydrolase [bacterium]|nr:MAG: cysteine hydrolase [bacterium]
MNPALIIIDMQKGFFAKEELNKQRDNLVQNINDLVNEFRNSKFSIVWIKQSMKPDLSDAPLGNKKSGKVEVAEGTMDNELLDGLNESDYDTFIIKKRYSGFFKTNLDEVLTQLKPSHLIFCGINTHACVRTTVIDAYMRDYEIVIAKDCVGSYDQTHHDVSMKYFSPNIAQVKTNKEIKEIIHKL